MATQKYVRIRVSITIADDAGYLTNVQNHEKLVELECDELVPFGPVDVTGDGTDKAVADLDGSLASSSFLYLETDTALQAKYLADGEGAEAVTDLDADGFLLAIGNNRDQDLEVNFATGAASVRGWVGGT